MKLENFIFLKKKSSNKSVFAMIVAKMSPRAGLLVNYRA